MLLKLLLERAAGSFLVPVPVWAPAQTVDI
ncbi:hypothetical protein H4W27_000386 [Nesterenkonia lutea]|uniref:Uncharacterized protein n=1 Tax=Nesterenkonia lutea TaxID=272919 RepID=A0ABR9JBF7_9MICC|nr:hypothetical protein [Nesterenkonia lutea]